MERAAFEAKLAQDGYERDETTIAAGEQRPAHAHDFDVRLLILDGDITLSYESGPVTYAAGDCCDVPAGVVHGEIIGPAGVHYLVGRRKQAG